MSEDFTPRVQKDRMTIGRAIFSLCLFAAICATGFAAAVTFRVVLNQGGPGGGTFTDRIEGASLHG